MLKVNGLNELAEIIEENNRIEKAEREIKKNRIKELFIRKINYIFFTLFKKYIFKTLVVL